MSPKAITSARPQGVNETYKFTDDVCRAASKIVNDCKNTVFANFATDGVSVETKDIMNAMFKFLDGKIIYLGGVDKEHDINHHRNQCIGGCNVASIGNTTIDVCLCMRTNISKYHISLKDL